MSKRKPSVIVMKRLDTQGMRVLSQTAGEGTRRAGVRLSPHGGLIVHRRGEPITGAPPPAAPFGIATASDAGEGSDGGEVDALAPTMLDPVMFIPHDVRAFANAAMDDQIRASSQSAHAALPAIARATTTTDAPTVAANPLPALSLEPGRRRASTPLLAIALMTLGVLTGITIARIVGGPRESDGRTAGDSIMPLAVVVGAANAPLPAVDPFADASVPPVHSARANGQSD